MSHSEQHQRALEDFFTAQVEAGQVQQSAQLRSLLGECEDCRTKFQELSALAALLGDEGLIKHKVMREAQELEGVPGLDRLAAFRARTLSSIPPSVPAPSGQTPARSQSAGWGRTAGWVAVATAALLLLAVTIGRSRDLPVTADTDAKQELLLGPGELGDLRPAGSVPDFSTFQWRYTLASGEYYQITVFDDSDAQASGMLAKRSFLDQTSWHPTPEQLAAWPRKIRWQVQVLRADGGVKLSAECSASRSSP